MPADSAGERCKHMCRQQYKLSVWDVVFHGNRVMLDDVCKSTPMYTRYHRCMQYSKKTLAPV